MSIPSHLDTVERARLLYADRSGTDRAHAICAYVSWEHRGEPEGQWGRFAKSNGALSSDVIALRVAGETQVYTYDILVDQEGEARPTWSPTKPTGRGDLSRWRVPQPPPGTIPQPPEPPPSNGECEPVYALLKRMDEQIAALSARVLALEGAAYVVSGTTSRDWGHGHGVSLPVRRVK